MVIAIDFDGTITDKNIFPEISELRPHVVEAIKHFQAAGHKCILWTCREGKHLDEARVFLRINGIELDGFNYSPYMLQSRKIVADVYIDDKNVFMVDDVDWYKIEEYILGLEDKTVKII
jgi:hydroxymethylpyrimidine pyrophosphatase-like HAD family hydrolase